MELVAVMHIPYLQTWSHQPTFTHCSVFPQTMPNSNFLKTIYLILIGWKSKVSKGKERKGKERKEVTELKSH